MARSHQFKLPGLEPGRQCNTLHIAEADLQRTIEQGLAYLGYVVLPTQHQYRSQPCPHCGRAFRPSGGYGAAKGIPDLLVTHPAWPVGVWLGLEVKGHRTPVSSEQQRLADQGRIVLVRTWEEARAAMEAARDRMMGEEV